MSDIIKSSDTTPLPIFKMIGYAAEHATIGTLDVESIHEIVKVAVMRAKQATGYNLEKDDLSWFVSEVERILFNQYPGLHVSEITIVFSLWAQQHYGKWVGFTISNFCWALKCYFEDPIRLRSLKQHLDEKQLKQKQIEQPSVQTLREKNRLAGKAAAVQLFDLYKSGKSIYDLGNLAYDYMVINGIVEPGYGNQFLKEAKRNIMRGHNPKLATDKKEFKELSNLMDEITEQGERHYKIVNEAKQLALVEAFKELISRNKDLKDLV